MFYIKNHDNISSMIVGDDDAVSLSVGDNSFNTIAGNYDDDSVITWNDNNVSFTAEFAVIADNNSFRDRKMMIMVPLLQDIFRSLPQSQIDD